MPISWGLPREMTAGFFQVYLRGRSLRPFAGERVPEAGEGITHVPFPFSRADLVGTREPTRDEGASPGGAFTKDQQSARPKIHQTDLLRLP